MPPQTEVEATEHPPIHCLLQLRYDGPVSVIAQHGCTAADAHAMLRLLTEAEWTAQDIA